MSKIARELTKVAGVAVVSASLLLQAVPAYAVEAGDKVENTVSIVEENEGIKDTEAVSLIADKNLEKSIRTKLNILDTKPLTKEDLAKLDSIPSTSNVKSLEGLQYCTNLKTANITGINNVDLSPLRNLTSIEQVVIGDCGEVDLNNFSKMTNLTYLTVEKISNKDLEALKNTVNLSHLMIYEAPNLSDISDVSSLKSLYALRINNNKVSDISMIGSLERLELLDFSHTNISDITVLSKLPNLRNAVLAYNKITDLSDLYSSFSEQNKAIYWLEGNMIADARPILSQKVFYQTALNQNAVLPQIITKGGDVVYKLPYAKELITSIDIDEKTGKYNPETNEITFYNITTDTKASYSIRLQNNLDGNNIDGSLNDEPGYDYSAKIDQPFKIAVIEDVSNDELIETPVIDEEKEPVKEPAKDSVEKPAAGKTEKPKNESTKADNTNVNKANDSAKTGDASAVGALSLAVMSLIGAVKSAKKRR